MRALLLIVTLFSQIALAQIHMTKTGPRGGGGNLWGQPRRDDKGFPEPHKKRRSKDDGSSNGRTDEKPRRYEPQQLPIIDDQYGFAIRSHQVYHQTYDALVDLVLKKIDYLSQFYNVNGFNERESLFNNVLLKENSPAGADARLSKAAYEMALTASSSDLFYEAGDYEGAEILRMSALRLHQAQNLVERVVNNHRWYDATYPQKFMLNLEAQREASYPEMLCDWGIDVAQFCFSISPFGFIEDLYGAVSHTNLWTGEKLTDFEWGIAVVGASTVGFGSKAIKAAHTFTKLDSARILRKDGTKLVAGIFDSKPISEIKQIYGFFKENQSHIKANVSYFELNEKGLIGLSKAFEGAKRTVLTEDTVAYRYYRKDGKDKGPWLTLSKTDNPKRDLALKSDGEFEVKEWIIPKGTEVLEGKIAPNFGEPGGMHQFFVPNIEVLR